ncbi:MAG: hypothetical protein Q4F49_10165 [Pseudoxanthomonas suwonensis]|nr:hypothetical protein [Pseudoxanthomonas suwonensis]
MDELLGNSLPGSVTWHEELNLSASITRVNIEPFSVHEEFAQIAKKERSSAGTLMEPHGAERLHGLVAAQA